MVALGNKSHPMDGAGPGQPRGVLGILKNMQALLQLLWKTAPFTVLLLLFLYAVEGVTPSVGTYVNKLALDHVARLVSGAQDAFMPAFRLLLLGFGLTLGGLGAGLGIATCEQYLSEQFSFKIEMLVNQKALHLPLMFFDQSDTYDKLMRAQGGFAERGVQATAAIMRLGSSVLTLISYLALLATVHWGLPLALLPVFVVSLILNMRWGQQRFRLNRFQTTSQREAGYLGGLLRGAEAAKEVRLFGLGDFLTRLWQNRFIEMRDQRLGLYWRQNSARLWISLLTVMTSSGVTLWLFAHLGEPGITLGAFVAMNAAVIAAVNQTPQMAITISQLYENALYTSNLTAFLELPDEAPTPGIPFPVPLQKGILVNNLEFSYPGAARPTLRGISFEVKPGERVAIVGENGAGKTTLIKCLLGLYQATSGQIEFDGLNINVVDQEHLRSQVSAVFQDFFRFALTPTENIGFGSIKNMANQAALDEAARKSGADRVIQSLSKGWQTKLGKMWGEGEELSYGQWQRLAIGRALLRDAQVVVLDEPTAALDPKAEAALFAQFMEASRGKTSFFISHRLGTARLADRIIVLKEGALIESGTHEQLMQRDGEYSRMFKAQARWYI